MSSSTLEIGFQSTSSAVQQHPTAVERDDGQRRVTRKQLHYMFISQGMGAALVDAICNFAIASAIYRTTHKEIRLWPLEENTIAGDMGVTVIIQGIMTTLISSALIRDDVIKKEIEPFPFAWPDASSWQAKSASWGKRSVGAAVSFLSPTQTLTLRHGGDHFAKSLCIILIRGFVISALYFVIFWPIAIAITAPLYGGIDMHGTWTPEIIKTIFGGTLGLFMNPFIAALVLGSRQPAGGSTPALTDLNSTPAHIVHGTSAPSQQNSRRQSSTFSHTRIASTALSTTLTANSPGMSVPRLQPEIA